MADGFVECMRVDDDGKPVEMFMLRRLLFSRHSMTVVYVEVPDNSEDWGIDMLRAVGAGFHGITMLAALPLVRERLWQNVRIILRQMEADGWRVFVAAYEDKLCALIAKDRGISDRAKLQKVEDSLAWQEKGMDTIDAWLMSLPEHAAERTYPSPTIFDQSNQCSS